MHVRDPKVQRSDFITSSLLHNEHPKFSLLKLDSGCDEQPKIPRSPRAFFSSGSLQSAGLIFNGDS